MWILPYRPPRLRCHNTTIKTLKVVEESVSGGLLGKMESKPDSAESSIQEKRSEMREWQAWHGRLPNPVAHTTSPISPSSPSSAFGAPRPPHPRERPCSTSGGYMQRQVAPVPARCDAQHRPRSRVSSTRRGASSSLGYMAGSRRDYAHVVGRADEDESEVCEYDDRGCH